MVENIRYFAIFLTVVLFASIASAIFSAGNPDHSIEDAYGPSESIRGWINISLTDESTNSLFEDSRGNSIKLIDLLKKDSRHSSPSCDPVDCSTDYTAGNGETSKTLSLDEGNSEIFGLKFTGNLNGINSVSFSLQSDAPIACVSQIEIDILDDGNIDFINNKIAAGGGCSNLENDGCYNALEEKKEYNLVTAINVPYCQKMNISESPGFYLGAWVKNVSGSLNLEMSLYDNNNVNVANCALPAPTNSGGEVSCSVDYPVSESREHYVCISSTGIGEYRIEGNSNLSEGCGFYGYPPPSNTPVAYNIFAEGRKFDSIGTLEIPNSLPNGDTWGTLIENYISDRYGSLDCSTGCVVPIRFISGMNQQITINNLVLNYVEKDAGIVTDNNFYDLTEIPAKVSSNFQKIYLDEGGFSVPDDLGAYEFSLSLDGTEIFSEEVDVEDIPMILSLIPVSTASAFPTEFKVGISSPTRIKKYFWDFGDGDVDVTTTNKVTHTYSSIGQYELTVTVTDLGELTSSKTFSVSVRSPKSLINTTLDKIKNNINNIKIYIVDLDLYAQESLNSFLDIDFAEEELERLEAAYDNATGEAEYNQIITDLLRLNVPSSLTESTRAESISFFPDRENIDLDILEAIGGGSYDSSRTEDYVNGVMLWNHENIKTKMDFSEFSGVYETSVDPILKVFEIDIEEKKDIGYDYFLILPELENLEFESSVVSTEEGGYVYVDLRGKRKISFSTTEDVDFVSLPAFISPGINRLSLTEIVSGEEEGKKSKLTIFILAISLLIIVAFISYVVLQEWYKKKYENYLFKNKNDLYNMVNYVNNSKKRGLKNKEISDNLRKAKWSSEQVKYVMKKYAGKRTGMLELPLTNLMKKVKKKSDFYKTR
ncbi:MAG TPA: PKD domain-containing protein [Candidatus Pacearchaeota archaeon]|nr:PKD domain-containing protein [Candidatus Pacearchaeota archaeon]